MIMNRIHENQNLLYIFSLIIYTIVVCINSISPIAMGCFICVNINFVIDISNFVMSGGILFKMLVLGINEMVSCLSQSLWISHNKEFRPNRTKYVECADTNSFMPLINCDFHCCQFP
jgi:hypothetical protein